ncbi:MAG: extracellular solute-binding protein [Candidatus Promineifilaceae bacterium]|jgi:multiple sugar transport system substrate-binding protein
MISKKISLLLLSLLLVGALLAACGGTTGGVVEEAPAADEAAPAADDSAAEEAPAAEAAAEPVTIRVWTHQNDAFNEGYQTLADAYMAANPNVTVEFETFDYDTYIQTLQTALPAGTEADVLQMFGSWVCSYAEGGNLAPLPESVISMADAKAAVFEAQLGGYECGDALYGIPQEFNIEYGATLVNTAVADEVGIADITAGWDNWDDFIADGQAMAVVQDGVMTRAGYNFTASDAIPATFYSLILQNGGQYLTDAGFSVNTDAGRAALELMKRMVDEGLVDPVLFNDESNWVGDSFFDGSSAMGLVGPWVVPEYGADYPEMIEVTKYVQLPTAGEDALVAASGWGLTVSENSDAQDTAWDFVKFVTLDPANAVQWNLASGTLPALKANATGAAAEELVAAFDHFGPFLGILENAHYEGAFPDRDLVWYEITYPRILNFLQGNATLDETLETIDREVNETLN